MGIYVEGGLGGASGFGSFGRQGLQLGVVGP